MRERLTGQEIKNEDCMFTQRNNEDYVNPFPSHREANKSEKEQRNNEVCMLTLVFFGASRSVLNWQCG